MRRTHLIVKIFLVSSLVLCDGWSAATIEYDCTPMIFPSALVMRSCSFSLLVQISQNGLRVLDVMIDRIEINQFDHLLDKSNISINNSSRTAWSMVFHLCSSSCFVDRWSIRRRQRSSRIPIFILRNRQRIDFLFRFEKRPVIFLWDWCVNAIHK